MNTATLEEMESIAAPAQIVLELPFGLLGFEKIKKYSLIERPGEAPFLWLQMLESDSGHAFLVISPFLIAPDYQPDLSREDVDFLNLQSPGDALVLAIVTLRGGAHATVNLKGPIVINRRTLIGKQVIPANASEFALRHPIPVP